MTGGLAEAIESSAVGCRMPAYTHNCHAYPYNLYPVQATLAIHVSHTPISCIHRPGNSKTVKLGKQLARLAKLEMLNRFVCERSHGRGIWGDTPKDPQGTLVQWKRPLPALVGRTKQWGAGNERQTVVTGLPQIQLSIDWWQFVWNVAFGASVSRDMARTTVCHVAHFFAGAQQGRRGWPLPV